MSRVSRPESLPIIIKTLSVSIRPERRAHLSLRFPEGHRFGFAAVGADLWLTPKGFEIVGYGARLPEWVRASLDEALRGTLERTAAIGDSVGRAFDLLSRNARLDLPFRSLSVSEYGRDRMASMGFGGVGAGSAGYQLSRGALRLATPRAPSGVTNPDGSLHPMSRIARERHEATFGPAAIVRIETALRGVAQRQLELIDEEYRKLPTEIAVLRP